MKDIKSFLLVGLLLLTVVSAQGCILLAGVAVGGGGVAYVLGELERNLDYSVEKVHKATLKALADLDIFVVEEGVLPDQTTIVAETVEGKKVKLKIEPLTKKASKISIRYGYLGNEERSMAVLNMIQKRL